MDTKKIIFATAVTLGVTAFGATNAHADQVKTTADTPVNQATSTIGSQLQARTYTLSSASLANEFVAIDDGTGASSGDIDDGTGSTSKPSDGGSTTKPSDGGSTTTPSDGGSTTTPSDGSSTTTPSDGSSTTDPSTGPDTGTTKPTTDPEKGTGTTNPVTNPDTGSSSNEGNNSSNVTQPDVTPVPVQADSSGQVVNVPVAVQAKPAVAQAVTSYNQALADNNGDSSAQPVVEAKAKLDKAIADTLPETGMKKEAGVSAVGVVLTTLGSALGLYSFGARAKLKKA